jgi:hypothetical protein
MGATYLEASEHGGMSLDSDRTLLRGSVSAFAEYSLPAPPPAGPSRGHGSIVGTDFMTSDCTLTARKLV